MKYVVIDVETTGTDPDKCQILEIGAIIEDTSKKIPISELPQFKCILKHDTYSGSAFAINMNSRIFEILSNPSVHSHHNVLLPHQAVDKFAMWLVANYFDLNPSEEDMRDVLLEPINVAGKNFAIFDKLFLDNLSGWKGMINYHRRFIDPALLFVDWKQDTYLPDLNTCLQRAKIDKKVTHNALEDAIDTLLCLRTQY